MPWLVTGSFLFLVVMPGTTICFLFLVAMHPTAPHFIQHLEGLIYTVLVSLNLQPELRGPSCDFSIQGCPNTVAFLAIAHIGWC